MFVVVQDVRGVSVQATEDKKMLKKQAKTDNPGLPGGLGGRATESTVPSIAPEAGSPGGLGGRATESTVPRSMPEAGTPGDQPAPFADAVTEGNGGQSSVSDSRKKSGLDLFLESRK